MGDFADAMTGKGQAEKPARRHGEGRKLCASENTRPIRLATVRYVPLARATRRMKSVPLDSDTMITARELGICFGD